jgi:hypothetical protein
MRSVLAGMLLTLAATSAEAQTTKPLFVIERSINKNVVHYDAQLTKDGKLNPKEPVVAYWIMADGRREDLNWLERTEAYGFTVTPGPAPGTYQIRLAAFKERPITIFQDAGGPKAELVIAGRPALLERVYVDAVETLGIPKVRLVELFGRDREASTPVSEKILPK